MAKKKTKIDLDRDDDEVILKEMAKALKCDPDELEISDGHPFGFRAGPTVKRVEMGNQEYYVVQDDGEAHELAREYVQYMLDEEPGNFEPNFIESHINLDRLRRDLMSDVQSSRYDDLKDEADRKPLKFMKDNDIEIPEPTEAQKRDWAYAMADDDKTPEQYLSDLEDGDAEDRWTIMGEEPEVPDSKIEEIAEREAEAQLKDPVEYLTEMLGQEDGVKKAIEIGGIDIDAAADEAVSTDGAGHFLSSYDGEISDTPNGLAYWRHN